MAELNSPLPEPDLVVSARKLVTPHGVRAGHVLVSGGRITALTDEDTAAPSVPRMDAGDHDVCWPDRLPRPLPTPGTTRRTGSTARAAVAGGFTTVMDIPTPCRRR